MRIVSNRWIGRRAIPACKPFLQRPQGVVRSSNPAGAGVPGVEDVRRVMNAMIPPHFEGTEPAARIAQLTAVLDIEHRQSLCSRIQEHPTWKFGTPKSGKPALSPQLVLDVFKTEPDSEVQTHFFRLQDYHVAPLRYYDEHGRLTSSAATMIAKAVVSLIEARGRYKASMSSAELAAAVDAELGTISQLDLIGQSVGYGMKMPKGFASAVVRHETSFVELLVETMRLFPDPVVADKFLTLETYHLPAPNRDVWVTRRKFDPEKVKKAFQEATAALGDDVPINPVTLARAPLRLCGAKLGYEIFLRLAAEGLSWRTMLPTGAMLGPLEEDPPMLTLPEWHCLDAVENALELTSPHLKLEEYRERLNAGLQDRRVVNALALLRSDVLEAMLAYPVFCAAMHKHPRAVIRNEYQHLQPFHIKWCDSFRSNKRKSGKVEANWDQIEAMGREMLELRATDHFNSTRKPGSKLKKDGELKPAELCRALHELIPVMREESNEAWTKCRLRYGAQFRRGAYLVMMDINRPSGEMLTRALQHHPEAAVVAEFRDLRPYHLQSHNDWRAHPDLYQDFLLELGEVLCLRKTSQKSSVDVQALYDIALSMSDLRGFQEEGAKRIVWNAPLRFGLKLGTHFQRGNFIVRPFLILAQCIEKVLSVHAPEMHRPIPDNASDAQLHQWFDRIRLTLEGRPEAKQVRLRRKTEAMWRSTLFHAKADAAMWQRVSEKYKAAIPPATAAEASELFAKWTGAEDQTQSDLAALLANADTSFLFLDLFLVESAVRLKETDLRPFYTLRMARKNLEKARREIKPSVETHEKMRCQAIYEHALDRLYPDEKQDRSSRIQGDLNGALRQICDTGGFQVSEGEDYVGRLCDVVRTTGTPAELAYLAHLHPLHLLETLPTIKDGKLDEVPILNLVREALAVVALDMLGRPIDPHKTPNWTLTDDDFMKGIDLLIPQRLKYGDLHDFLTATPVRYGGYLRESTLRMAGEHGITFPELIVRALRTHPSPRVAKHYSRLQRYHVSNFTPADTPQLAIEFGECALTPHGGLNRPRLHDICSILCRPYGAAERHARSIMLRTPLRFGLQLTNNFQADNLPFVFAGVHACLTAKAKGHELPFAMPEVDPDPAHPETLPAWFGEVRQRLLALPEIGIHEHHRQIQKVWLSILRYLRRSKRKPENKGEAILGALRQFEKKQGAAVVAQTFTGAARYSAAMMQVKDIADLEARVPVFLGAEDRFWPRYHRGLARLLERLDPDLKLLDLTLPRIFTLERNAAKKPGAAMAWRRIKYPDYRRRIGARWTELIQQHSGIVDEFCRALEVEGRVSADDLKSIRLVAESTLPRALRTFDPLHDTHFEAYAMQAMEEAIRPLMPEVLPEENAEDPVSERVAAPVGVRPHQVQRRFAAVTAAIPNAEKILERVAALVTPFIDSPEFHDVHAETRIFIDAPDIQFTHAAWFREFMSAEMSDKERARRAMRQKREQQIILTGAEERVLFLQFNYARYRLWLILQQWQADGLTPEQAAEVLHWDRTSRSARDHIANVNLALVIAMARRTRSLVDFDELVTEGMMALLRSIDGFDCGRGFKFSTYACRAILKHFSRIGMRHGRYRDQFPVGFDPVLQKSDHAERRHANQAADYASDIREIFEANEAGLTDVEQTVIIHRFGWDQDDPKPMILEEVGKIIGVTKERVRQIQTKAIEKLRVALDARISGVSPKTSEQSPIDDAADPAADDPFSLGPN